MVNQGPPTVIYFITEAFHICPADLPALLMYVPDTITHPENCMQQIKEEKPYSLLELPVILYCLNS